METLPCKGGIPGLLRTQVLPSKLCLIYKSNKDLYGYMINQSKSSCNASAALVIRGKWQGQDSWVLFLMLKGSVA